MASSRPLAPTHPARARAAMDLTLATQQLAGYPVGSADRYTWSCGSTVPGKTRRSEKENVCSSRLVV